MSLLDDEIREANGKHVEELHNSALEHLAFLEKSRIQSEACRRGSPLLETFRARRQAQVEWFKNPINAILKHPKV